MQDAGCEPVELIATSKTQYLAYTGSGNQANNCIWRIKVHLLGSLINS